MIKLSDNEKNLKADASRKTLEAIYGEMPPRPLHLSCRTVESNDNFAAGKATLSELELILDLGEKEATIPLVSIIPKSDRPSPALIYLGFDNNVPNKFLPAEEIIDRGYAIFSLCLSDVSECNESFKSGISNHIARSRKRKASPGKLSVWAWAVCRVFEYVRSLGQIRSDCITISGHGIGARVAMLSSAYCEADIVIANGISTKPLPYSSEVKASHSVLRDYPYLYCPAFIDGAIDEYSALVYACGAKNILIGEAQEGEYPDTQRDAKLISLIKERFGLGDGQKNIPTEDLCLEGENFSYHLRPGTDYLSREDWNIYLDFIDKKLNLQAF